MKTWWSEQYQLLQGCAHFFGLESAFFHVHKLVFILYVQNRI